MGLEEAVKDWNFFTIETKDREVYERLLKKIEESKRSTTIYPGDGLDKYYTIMVSGKNALLLALNGEEGSYEVSGRLMEHHLRCKPIYEHLQGEQSFAC